MFIEYPMNSPLFLSPCTHRKEPCWFVDYDDRIVEMDDSETVFKRRAALCNRCCDRQYVACFQPGIVPDAGRALDRHRAEADKVFRLLARQS